MQGQAGRLHALRRLGRERIIHTGMSVKEHPNHRLYIQTLRRMSPEAKLLKAFELSQFSRDLFLQGLRKRFPDLSPVELRKKYLDRLNKCHNRNY